MVRSFSTFNGFTQALIYQSCIETCDDLSAKVMGRKDAHVIHENVIHECGG